MSWHGSSAAGAPTYPPQTKPYSHPGTVHNHQQSHQYGSQMSYGQNQSVPPYSGQISGQRPLDHRPLKKKGNPIITRYPPPPGYRAAQPQPQGPFGFNQHSGQYQSPHPGYPAPSVNSVYPLPNYSSQPAYPPNHGYPQSQNSTGWPSFPPSNARPPMDSVSISAQINAGHTTNQASQSSSQPTSAVSESGPSGKPQLFLAWDDWDFDFEGAIWPKSNEPVDPNLSLGVVIWHPAKQTTRALPSTFADAEEQALRPAPEKLNNGESVSMFFMLENSHEAFLDVRQTEEWERIRYDPVFVTFTDEKMRNSLISFDDCIAQRDRPDHFSKIESEGENEDETMNDATWDIMDNLEQALSGSNGIMKTEATKEETILSEPAQEESQGVIDSSPSQEDILASLGVTGLPKPPSNNVFIPPFPVSEECTPTQVFGISPVDQPSIPYSKTPLPPQRAHSFGGYKSSRDGFVPQRAYGSMSSSSKNKPTPPVPLEDLRHNSWHGPQGNGRGYDALTPVPVLSHGKDQFMANPNFNTSSPTSRVKHELPMKPALHRSDSSKKRSYQDTGQEDEQQYQSDDQTKRKRRLQIDPAYR